MGRGRGNSIRDGPGSRQLDQWPHIAVGRSLFARWMELGHIGYQVEGMVWLEGRYVVASVFVEGFGAQGKGGGQTNGERITRLVVGCLDQSYIHPLKRGGQRQSGAHIRQHKFGAEPPYKCPFSLHTAVYPLCVVIAIVAAGHVLIHAALRHGLYRVHWKPLVGDPGGVRPYPGEFYGVAARVQGSSHDQRADSVGQTVAVEKDQYRILVAR